MSKVNLLTRKNVYMVGIAGSSMRGIAFLLSELGCKVSGSDRGLKNDVSEYTEHGIMVFNTHDAKNLPDDTDIVVYTLAVGSSNPEIEEARKRGITLMTRAEFLGEVIDCFERRIGISGTHGKSTVSSMITTVLANGGHDISYNVGCTIKSDFVIPEHGRTKDMFVFEACEYRDSFLNFRASTAVILNIELEHLDYFSNIDQIKNSFLRFANNLSENGVLVINADDKNTVQITDRVRHDIKVVTCSVSKQTADYRAENITYGSRACARYTIFEKGKACGIVELAVPGEHNVINSLCACAALRSNGASWKEIIEGIKHFSGAGRRFDYRGNIGALNVYDDYAHHPSEIKATLQTAKKLGKPVLCVFQPHTYSRTKHLFRDEAEALAIADDVVLVDIYAAREADPGDINSCMICDEIKQIGGRAEYAGTLEAALKYLIKVSDRPYTVITMGAGDICNIYGMYKAACEKGEKS